MKKYLATGFITLLPLTITIVLVVWLVNIFTTPFVGIVKKIIISFEAKRGIDLMQYEGLVIFISRIIVLIFLFALTLFLGFLVSRFFSKIKLYHKLFSHIPFVKTIYSISKDVTNALFAGDQKTFKKTVLIPFPKKDVHSIGFVTGEIPAALKAKIGEADIAVFVPTSPHPISGYILMTRSQDTLEVDLSTEDALKFILSCGVIHPEPPTQVDHEPGP